MKKLFESQHKNQINYYTNSCLLHTNFLNCLKIKESSVWFFVLSKLHRRVINRFVLFMIIFVTFRLFCLFQIYRTLIS